MFSQSIEHSISNLSNCKIHARSRLNGFSRLYGSNVQCTRSSGTNGGLGSPIGIEACLGRPSGVGPPPAGSSVHEPMAWRSVGSKPRQLDRVGMNLLSRLNPEVTASSRGVPTSKSMPLMISRKRLRLMGRSSTKGLVFLFLPKIFVV